MGDILTYGQYAEMEKHGFSTPYVVEIRSSSQALLFYGSEHTSNPKHLQFQDIEERWSRFINEVDNPIALVEGRFDEVPEEETKSKTKSIANGGEAQFLVHIARRDGVEDSSPEPNRTWEADKLAEEFGKNKVAFYYFIRQVCWWNGFAEKPDIKIEATKMLQNMHKSYGWKSVDFSVKGMATIHEALFGKPFSWDDTQWIYNITTPASVEHVTNEISRRSGQLRDEYILDQIEQYWQAGRSPFAVFGYSHAVRLEPALKNLINC